LHSTSFSKDYAMSKMLKAAVAAAILAASVPAMAEVVVVVSAKAAESSMSKEDVAQFFLGKSSAMTPIDQPEDAAIRGEFYKKVTDKDASQAKALWSKLVFTGKATMPKEVANSAAVKSAVAANPKAIGYMEKSAVDGSVKVVYTAP
jgi:ABC-type phosphate transport system substrate-binding protein